MNSVACDEQLRTARGTVARILYRQLGLAEAKKNSDSDYHVSGEGLPQNWIILLGHRRLQYIGEEPLGVAGG
jgi:hypothetical protein